MNHFLYIQCRNKKQCGQLFIFRFQQPNKTFPVHHLMNIGYFIPEGLLQKLHHRFQYFFLRYLRYLLLQCSYQQEQFAVLRQRIFQFHHSIPEFSIRSNRPIQNMYQRLLLKCRCHIGNLRLRTFIFLHKKIFRVQQLRHFFHRLDDNTVSLRFQNIVICILLYG